MLELRPYQTDALAALYKYWDNGGEHPLVVMATGTGKSLVQGTLAQQLIEGYPLLRIIAVTHVKELIEQNFKELIGIWPLANAGMYSAGLGQRNLSARILFCGIQSIHTKAKSLGHVDLVMIDECHLCPRNADTMYGRFITALLEINPDMRIVGFTATPYRTDSGRLDEGDERLFTDIVFDYGIAQGIKDGYLSPLSSKGTDTGFDLSDVARRGGDFVPGSLQTAVDKADTTREAVAEIVRAGRNRRSWLVFCAGVEHAIHVRDEIRSHSITCEAITGDTPDHQRDLWIAQFRAGTITALTNNSVLTTGLNAPYIDLIAGLRPTLSATLYVQMAGRGTRPIYAPGFDLRELSGRLTAITAGPKPNCLYMDFAGNVRLHGPVDLVEARKPGKGGGEAPVKECPACRELVHISATECPCCGHLFDINEKPKHTATAEVLPVLSTEAPPWLKVQSRKFVHHENMEGAESVRVEYMADFTSYKMWLSLKKAKSRADKFWRDHSATNPPRDVEEFLYRQGELNQTNKIQVRRKKGSKYSEIVGIIAAHHHTEATAQSLAA
jgi:DNA repair protein RadD